MENYERVNWLCNIRNAASDVSALLGVGIVQHVLLKYGARSIEDLLPCYYSEVFNELDYMANDARD